ncbi:MAG: hypothetical protein IJP64_05090 [Oscillospiraceae bacterium]|nr:hypothetical protein [Oscillospiraceae bacterium]
MDAEKLARELDRDGKGTALRQLGASPEGKKLEGMIDGAALQKAFACGDAAALKKMLGELLSTPEGRALAENVGRIMER